MIKKFSYFIFPVAVIFSVILYSCSSDVYDEDDIIVVRDTVTIKRDTTISEQRETEKLRLLLVIQVGAFRDRTHAENFASTVKDKLFRDADIRKTGDIYIVTIGSFTETSKADEFLYTVRSKGFDRAFIKNVKY
jgi:cell division septation protein DedD